MSTGNLLNLLIFLFILWRQTSKRRVRDNFILPVALIVLGLSNLLSYSSQHPLTSVEIILLVISFIGPAAGLGYLRGLIAIKIWVDKGIVMRQGTWLNLVLWILSLGLHLAIDSAIQSQAASISLMLYMGITLGAQRIAINSKARRFTHVSK